MSNICIFIANQYIHLNTIVFIYLTISFAVVYSMSLMGSYLDTQRHSFVRMRASTKLTLRLFDQKTCHDSA